MLSTYFFANMPGTQALTLEIVKTNNMILLSGITTLLIIILNSKLSSYYTLPIVSLLVTFEVMGKVTLNG